MITIISRDPRGLAPHPLNRAMPRLHEGMAEWAALVADIADRGVLEPIKIVGRHVVDGETRRGAAIAAGLQSVPCVEVPESEVVATLREKLVLQKHLSKGQRAYLMIPLVDALGDEAAARRIANLRRGNTTTVDAGKPTFEEFCREHGFSKDLGEQARTLHGIFAGDKRVLRERNLEGIDHETLRREWEPKILDFDHPVGLGAALAGIAGEKATKDKAKTPNAETQLELFSDGVSTLARVARAYPKLRKEQRPELLAVITRASIEWPEDFRCDLASALLASLPDPKKS